MLRPPRFSTFPTTARSCTSTPSAFRLTLPAMPPGHYQLYGDVVRVSGFPETLLSTVDIPANMDGSPLAPDDASAVAAPVTSASLGSSFKLPDGYTMTWDRPNAI